MKSVWDGQKCFLQDKTFPRKTIFFQGVVSGIFLLWFCWLCKFSKKKNHLVNFQANQGWFTRYLPCVPHPTGKLCPQASPGAGCDQAGTICRIPRCHSQPPPPPPNSCPLVPKLCKSPSLWVWERPETMMGFHSYHRLGYVAEVKGFCRCNKGL